MSRKETNKSLRNLVETAQETGDWTPVEQADVSAVTDMSRLFEYTVNIKDLDLSGWDTSSVTSMHSMFAESDINHPSVGLLNTSNVEDMRSMFHESKYNHPLYFDTSNVKNMEAMFHDSPFNANQLRFNTKNVTNMSAMFCSSKYNKPIEFDTSNVTNMCYMFAYSDFSHPLHFDTSNVENMDWMFAYSSYNKEILFDASSVESISNFLNERAYKQALYSILRTIDHSVYGIDDIIKIHMSNHDVQERIDDFFKKPEPDKGAAIIDDFWFDDELVASVKNAVLNIAPARKELPSAVALRI